MSSALAGFDMLDGFNVPVEPENRHAIVNDACSHEEYATYVVMNSKCSYET